MSLTHTQQQAVVARGNILVVAGAGTGKTRTLVERCLHCLIEERPAVQLDEILMVTFTEAAAAEMRQRIRLRLEEEQKKQPEDPRWAEQLALFETAHIGTLHSFCLQLVRQHFYELELDPQLTVLAEEESHLLAEETLDGLMQKHYSGRGRGSEAVQELIHSQGRGGDKPIRRLVLRLHEYTQARPDPQGWYARQLEQFGSPEAGVWQQWLEEAVVQWRSQWFPVLTRLEATNPLAGNCAAAVHGLKKGLSRREMAEALRTVGEAQLNCPKGRKTECLKPLKEFLADADFLLSLLVPGKEGGADPLLEDWNWVRTHMSTLLGLARDFCQAFTEAKRELGVVDFQDLEQYALRLLWDAAANQPTRTALQWRKKLRFVFVDEYQDINAAQDKIIEALGREGAEANRFLVGDVKQSIYRFRLADPHIFQGYVAAWQGERGLGIPLTENFRSREGVLDCINRLFEVVMRPEVGGVHYDEEAKLRFGAPQERRPLSLTSDQTPCVELHLRVKRSGLEPSAEEGSEEVSHRLADLADLEDADKEARLVALRLRELKARQTPVWDEKLKGFRPAQWSDMAILLRSPSGKSESYAKEFSRLNVPLLVERGGFYQSLEILDLLSVLELLDNPLQDVPALAVLHSPLVGLTLNELGHIRLAALRTRFWTALTRWQELEALKLKSDGETAVQPSETFLKVAGFLERFGRWRRLARQVSLSRCLEAVLSETHYAEWLLTQPRGEQRHANVQRLMALAQQFDQFQRQGLFRFLRFIEAQQEAETEPEVAPVSDADSVRLMSIHQSKGLEFPIVVVADLSKPFNMTDLRDELILDELYGLCPQVQPPHTGSRYPSLPYWLARRRQRRELLGEELRLLYVAMTRARDRLVLSAGVPESKCERLLNPVETESIHESALLGARSYTDWLGLWFSRQKNERETGAREGLCGGMRWVVHPDEDLLESSTGIVAAVGETKEGLGADAESWETLRKRLSWSYPFSGATRQPAKTSVSILRRRAVLADEESVWLAADGRNPEAGFELRPEEGEDNPKVLGKAKKQGLSATEIGNAHHSFMELVALERTVTLAELKQEAQRLVAQGGLTEEQGSILDFEGLFAFWSSELGCRVRAEGGCVRRELAFTMRFAPRELAELMDQKPDPTLEEEFVVVQGVADVAVLRPDSIWLVDFKTDHARPGELAEKARHYQPQLKLYARALSEIYRRPVTESWLYFLSCRKAVSVSVA